MKLFTTLALILFTLTLKAQLVSCPPELTFRKDSVTIQYTLQNSGNTDWKTILNLNPNPSAKEGYTYDEWIPLQTNIKPVSDFLTTFMATQYRSETTSGLVQMQSYYCVHVIRGTKKK